jgi:hypothetical protein
LQFLATFSMPQHGHPYFVLMNPLFFAATGLVRDFAVGVTEVLPLRPIAMQLLLGHGATWLGGKIERRSQQRPNVGEQIVNLPPDVCNSFVVGTRSHPIVGE